MISAIVNIRVHEKILISYLFLPVLGLGFCVWAFPSCSKPGLLFIAVHGLHIAMVSLVLDHRV